MPNHGSVPQPTSLDLRVLLQEKVFKDLLGPMDGPEEEVEEPNVHSRYIVGQLAPPNQVISPSELDELAVAGDDDDQDGKTDSVVPQSASMLPSAIGMTFSVAREAQSIQVTARWGYYKRTTSETRKTSDGKPVRVWKRHPVEGISDPIPLRDGPILPWCPDPENRQVFVHGLCRARNNAWIITLFLRNNQEPPKSNKDEAWLFQPELEVTDSHHRPIFIKRQLPDGLNEENVEDRTMAMLYRKTVEFAVGHGVGVHVELPDGEWERASKICTRVIPSHEVDRMDPPTEEHFELLGHVVLDMKQLAETATGNFAASLSALADAYEQWIESQEAQLDNPPPDLLTYHVVGRNTIGRCRDTLKRIRRGIALLDEDEQAAEAFRFTNAAMRRQRVRSIYARQVRQGEDPQIEKIDVPKNRSWRPFQLAFLLLNLPALHDPSHEERDAIADLLWFPTGGGKTEAYLGVAAFAMAVRRLQGNLGGYGYQGVTVLMRYTLRLLTLQQFQRATALIAACEVLRRENPGRWGSEPFRIGLWVGQRSTPNYTDQAAEAIKQDRNNWWSGAVGGSGTPAQLTNCPWCGSPIDPGKNIVVESSKQGRGRTLQYCSDKYGCCPFTQRQSPGEGLPILVVDEEIYRFLPTLLIATVDKFAQMPWKGETQMLFGRVTGHCPRHGYLSPTMDDTGNHRRNGQFPATQREESGPLRPPDLIIQDELHLISGPLGTLVGLYETAIDRLGTWKWKGKNIRPKVIASTATIRRAREQIHNLFVREVNIFPPSGLSADDNFFSVRRPSSEESPGRLYLGVCAPGIRLKTVLIRVYVAFMAAAQELYEEYPDVADPWMTMVGYFNSMRELGGMRRVADDAIRTRLQKMDERGLTERFINHLDIQELTSRKSAAEIPEILDRLEVPFSPETVGPLGKVKSKGFRAPAEAKRPLDIVLATNMISVGVDVGRLGLMVTAGQPKATAEYIQATSRVGREFPGIVCTVYNWARPRDLSHYERFEHYHATFYQQVEALSVTPFAPQALHRGLSGVLVSLVRLLGGDFNDNTGADRLQRLHHVVEETRKVLEQRARTVTERVDVGEEVRRQVEERIDKWLSKRDSLTSADLGYKSKKGERIVPLLHQPTEKDWDDFTCLNSLRDVEPQVRLVLNDYGMDRAPSTSSSNIESGRTG